MMPSQQVAEKISKDNKMQRTVKSFIRDVKIFSQIEDNSRFL